MSTISGSQVRDPWLQRALGHLPGVPVGGLSPVWGLNGLFIILVAGLYLGFIQQLAPFPQAIHVPWWALAGGFALAEVSIVHVTFRSEAHSFSLSEIPLIIGLFFVSPAVLLAAHLAGAFMALKFSRRQPPVKLVFNLGHFGLESCLGVLVFRAIANPADPLGPRSWLGTAAAVVVISLVGVTTTIAAISLSEGRLQVKKLHLVLGLGLGTAMTNSCLALAAVSLLILRPAVVWQLAIPSGLAFFAYRAYAAERRKRNDVALLYESSRMLQADRDIESSILGLLSHARDMFRADIAEIALLPSGDDDDSVVRSAVGPGTRRSVMTHSSSSMAESVMAHFVSQSGPMTARRPHGEAVLESFMQERGLLDMMVTPLRGETRIIGLMLIGNRLGKVGSFDAQDLRLLEMLAGNTSVALENGRLEQRLKHQAFHDALTNLANRNLFADRVQHALGRRIREGETAAVLFLDLDDFKSVNDSMGHAAGDHMLMSVAERLRACLRPHDTGARLGGDEFAILLEETNTADAERVANRVLDALRVPFVIQGEEVLGRASIGVATWDGKNPDVDEILRNADVAMYIAKGTGKNRIAVFEQSMKDAVVKRHALKLELERAVERQEFRLHYQPIVDLDTTEIVAVEALVRWNHAERGMVPPNDFIPLAEETGLIVALGRWVLGEACAQLSRLQAGLGSGRELSMTVNVSGRQLQQAGFVAEVREVLVASGINPRSLILEITESVMMEHSQATLNKMQELRDMGVRLAVDDFGTGYSSLSSLQHLPVDIFKLAKPFVDDLAEGSNRDGFVDAIVKLGASMNLGMVAEGIELPIQRNKLVRLGCDMGQGYLFGKPMEGAEMAEVLRADRARRGHRLSKRAILAS